MKKVSDLSREGISQALKQDGLRLQIGPFTVAVQSSLPAIMEGISLLYSDYPLAGSERFIDFHVNLFQPRHLRRWLKPQIFFALDNYIPFKPLPLNQALPMLEWGLNWCISNYAHQYLIIHAAVIERGGRALIMPAPSGSGKSTLCAALINRGWRLLSDELALVSPNDLRITPLPRPISLKNESISLIQGLAPGIVLSRPAVDTKKGMIAHTKAPADSIFRRNERAAPAWIVCPRYRPNASAQWQSLSKAQSLLRIAENSFNYSLLGALGFNTTADLVDTCDCYEFIYSDLDEAIAIFDTLAVFRRARQRRI